MTVPTILVTIGLANLIYDLTGFIIKCFNRTKRENDIEKIDMCNRSYVQALREIDDYATYITHKHDNQIVYKVDGDFNGDIKGDNVTVILMGNGDFKGDVNSKNGTVFLNKGNVIGDIKADKVLMPNKKKDTYFGRRGIVVRCPHCDELYTQSLSINGYTSEDGANLSLDVKIDAEEPLDKSPDIQPTCHSCRYYSSYDNCAYYYCEHHKDNFCNPYNTCDGYVARI